MIERSVFGWNIDEDQLLLDMVKRYKIGGIIVYRKNIRNNFQDFLQNIKKNSINKDIIIAVDQEGGSVRRFTDEDIFVMAARDASELLNPIQYEVSVEYMARKLKKIGITLILAPVIDLAVRCGGLWGVPYFPGNMWKPHRGRHVRRPGARVQFHGLLQNNT